MSRADAVSALEEELEASRIRLLAGEESQALLRALQMHFPDFSDNLYIVSCLPEQGEDLYNVLVDGATIVHVEISRHGTTEPLVEHVSLERYRQIHSAETKAGRRRLDAALRLSRQRQST